MTDDWQRIATRKRDLRARAISQFRAEHEAEALREICLEDDLEVLSQRLRDGTWTAEQVIKAYAVSAAEADKSTNCLTEIIFSDALDRARELDTHMRREGPLGPLHGVPITVKDQWDVEGYDTTLGYVGGAFKPAEKSSVLVAILESLGAIVFAKTNLSQGIMWCETENNLWGLTTHPLNAKFTPGGSSGGEAALLSLNGSILGFGTDLAGSIRMPASLTGVYGLKPSVGRIPYYGAQMTTDGQEHVPSVAGPMARTLSGITSIMRLLLAQSEPWTLDPQCICMPWQEDRFTSVQSRPFTVGLLFDDGVVRPHPPIQRYLKAVAAALEAAGHTVVVWTPEGHKRCYELMDKYVTSDFWEDIRNAVVASGEPFIPYIDNLISRSTPIPITEYWAVNQAKLVAQKAYLDRWQGQSIDVLLTPVLPHCAVPHRKMSWTGYTKIWNFLDYTALSLPVGFVDKHVDLVSSHSHVPRNADDAANWGLFDPEAMHGMPVSLQLVGRTLEEEKVLGAATVIDTLLRGL